MDGEGAEEKKAYNLGIFEKWHITQCAFNLSSDGYVQEEGWI